MAGVRVNALAFSKMNQDLPAMLEGMIPGNLIGRFWENKPVVRGAKRTSSTFVLTMSCRLVASSVNCCSYPKTHETQRNSSFRVGVCLPNLLPNPKTPLICSLLIHESTHSPIKGRQVATVSYLSQMVAISTS